MLLIVKMSPLLCCLIVVKLRYLVSRWLWSANRRVPRPMISWAPIILSVWARSFLTGGLSKCMRNECANVYKWVVPSSIQSWGPGYSIRISRDLTQNGVQGIILPKFVLEFSNSLLRSRLSGCHAISSERSTAWHPERQLRRRLM